MDPLAAPLACACVAGVGQRDYPALAAYLEQRLNRKVKLTFDESLDLALPRAGKNVDLVIGKRSIVLFDAKRKGLQVRAIAALTDRAGRTGVRGAVMVRNSDPAQSLRDLAGRTLVLAPGEDDESHAAVKALLARFDLTDKVKLRTGGAIDSGPVAVFDDEADAAATSDFMPPLLEGCGKVDPGSLRVIAHTDTRPFVQVFATARVSKHEQAKLNEALCGVARDVRLLHKLESLRGFVPVQPDWPDWRGPQRDGLSNNVPRAFPINVKRLWTAQVTGPAMAGVAVSGRYLVAPDKSADLKYDIFRCFDAHSGKPLWTLRYKADKDVDYTNAPRASPVIADGLVYLQGALGDLHCVELATGKVVWKTNIVTAFGGKLLTWGSSAPPMVVGDRLITNPGAPKATMAAFNRHTGKLAWQSSGHATSYGAYMLAQPSPGMNTRRQVVGFDVNGLNGWDVHTGKHLWVVTSRDVDFNVCTPAILGDTVLAAGENNGTRLYQFDSKGMLQPKPIAVNDDMAPDTCSPVVYNGRVFATAYGELFCLDLRNGLKTVWRQEDDRFHDHCNIIAGNGRLMVSTMGGELILIDADADTYREAGSLKPFTAKGDEDIETMSHPVIVGDRLYWRSKHELICLGIGGTTDEHR